MTNISPTTITIDPLPTNITPKNQTEPSDSIEPSPDNIEPDNIEPSPDNNEPSPDNIEPDNIEPSPDNIEPDNIEPSPDNIEPSPEIHENTNNQPESSQQVRLSILRESLHPVTLKFEDVTYSISLDEPKTSKVVLNGVTGLVRPGELLAMLGPSGSGKTTLLTALAGRIQGKLSGTITYNGHPFSSSMKRKTGFVTQDDVLYSHLTVSETLTYAALLRLPKTLTRAQKIEQVEMVITELGLTRCRNGVVGGPLLRGISGGERKRVSVGQELLVNPSLLFLDEPTSGLDSTTAQRIVEMLKGLARVGRTVITTIHQPSSRLYQMFDKVALLSDGNPIYFGQAGRVMDYFASIGYTPGFNFMNPADFLLDLANGTITDIKHEEQTEVDEGVDQNNDQNSTKQSLILSYTQKLYPVLLSEINQNSSETTSTSTSTPSSLKKDENQWTTNWWDQFKILLQRGLKERKHESYSRLTIIQVMSVSILSGLFWWNSNTSRIQDQVGLLFFLAVFWGSFPLFSAIFVFPQERPILIKERSSCMYRLSSYYFARVAGDLPMELVLPTIFTIVTYLMGGLKRSLITFILTLLVILYNVLVAQALGLALGATVKNLKQATTLASVTMLVFILVGGYYIQKIPPFIAWLKYVSFSHYSYKLLVEVQYSLNEVYECGNGVRCRVGDFPLVKSLGVSSLWWDVGALGVMLVGFRVLAYVSLRMGLPH